jgi:hypothetical protein
LSDFEEDFLADDEEDFLADDEEDFSFPERAAEPELVFLKNSSTSFSYLKQNIIKFLTFQ